MGEKKKKLKQKKTNSLIYKYKGCPGVPSVSAVSVLRLHGPCLEGIRGAVSLGLVHPLWVWELEVSWATV